MGVKREESLKIREKIMNLLTEIMYRAGKINDRDICGRADKCMVHLNNLFVEIESEDEKAANPQ